MEKFNDEIRRAIESYPRPNPPAHFDARVLAALREKREKRGLRAALLRFWQLEIEGVAVWRLAFSGLGGAAFCALILGAALAFSSEKPAPKIARETPPKSDFPAENFGAFYAREPEFSPSNSRESDEENRLQNSPSLRVFPFSDKSKPEVSCVSPRNWA